jgi:hypothetical protein
MLAITVAAFSPSTAFAAFVASMGRDRLGIVTDKNTARTKQAANTLQPASSS